MTRPTNAVHIPALTDNGGIFLSQEQRLEIAALLRELADAMCGRFHYKEWNDLRSRARAMAEQLQPTQEES